MSYIIMRFSTYKEKVFADMLIYSFCYYVFGFPELLVSEMNNVNIGFTWQPIANFNPFGICYHRLVLPLR